MSHTDDRATAPAAVRCAVPTVSDTRKQATDRSGAAIRVGLAGFEKGTRLAVERLLLPELGHLVWDATR